MTPVEDSLDEKIRTAFDVSYDLSELLNRDALKTDRDTVEMIWGHADGLTAKWLYDRRDGRCSLQASIDFDIEAEEKKLDGQIALMRKLWEEHKT